MRKNVEAARDQGVNLGFFSANTSYWQIRLENNDRTIIAYKDPVEGPHNDPFHDSSDPNKARTTTMLWKDNPVGLPEDALLGVSTVRDHIVSPPGPLNILLPNHWSIVTPTSVCNPTCPSIPGVIGGELDGINSYFLQGGGHAPDGIETIAEWNFNSQPTCGTPNINCTHVTSYVAPSGATVFAVGAFTWGWGLDDYNAGTWRFPAVKNAAVQTITSNVLFHFTQPLQPNPHPLYQGYALVPSPSSITAGQSVTVTITAPGCPSCRNDWIGLYNVGDDDRGFLQFVRVSGTGTTLNVPLQTPGLYEFRYFLTNGYTRTAVSSVVTVTSGGVPNLTVNGSSGAISVSAGAPVAVGVQNGPANPTDWVGLYQTGAADTAYLNWFYLNGSKTAPTSGLASANVPFTMPGTLGDYEFRFFSNNGFTRLATSPMVTITSP